MGSSFERILVPTDMSGFSDLALRYALHFQECLGSKITLLHAKQISWFAAEHPLGYYIDNVPEEKTELIRQLNRYAASHVPPEGRVTTLCENDTPVPAILRTAGEIEADLIVMGTHGHGGLRRALLGSVAETVLRETDRPVITVNPTRLAAGAIDIHTVLCPVNFSDVARGAIAQASAIAKAFDAQLIVVHVCEGTEPQLFSDVRNQFGIWIDPLVRSNTTYREIVVHGDAAEQVLAIADQVNAGLLVIGAEHHQYSANATVIGTTSERITRFAQHPVMTVIRKPFVARKQKAMIKRQKSAAALS